MASKLTRGGHMCPDMPGWKQVTSATLGQCTLTCSVTDFGFEAQYWNICCFRLPLSPVPRQIEHSVWGNSPFKKLLYNKQLYKKTWTSCPPELCFGWSYIYISLSLPWLPSPSCATNCFLHPSLQTQLYFRNCSHSGFVLFGHKYGDLERKVEVFKLALFRFVPVMNLVGYLNRCDFSCVFVVGVEYCGILL